MPRVYGVQDDDDKLSGWMSEDETETAPTGETAVLESVIRAADPPGADGRIQSGGHWDGTAYTPPVGDEFFLPFDGSTDTGLIQIAALTLHESFHDASAGVHSVRHEKPQIDVARAEQFIAMGHWANYVVAHMAIDGDITATQFEAWATAMALGASDVTTVQTYFEKAHQLNEVDIPLEACAWVNPTDAVAVALKNARKNSTQDTEPTHQWFNGETVDLTEIDLGNGAWIRRLPEA